MTKASVLDDPDGIRNIDRNDMLSFCVEAPKHYREAARLARMAELDFPTPQKIIVAGMGGSAIGGELLKDWARDRVSVPIEVCREYSLPAHVDKNTLVVVTSYSGETEESLSVFVESVKRKCMTACISSGGALHEFAERLNVPHLRVPFGMAPRAALPYLFVPLTVLVEKLGLVSGVALEVSDAVESLKKVSKGNRPQVPLEDNDMKTLALRICGTIPAVYGFGFYRSVAQRFKTQFNENSKLPAKWEVFPELDHNEIVGWEGVKDRTKFFSVILIRDRAESEEIKLRIDVTKELVAKESICISEVNSIGSSRLARMVSVICMGDFTSVYLAVLRGMDPTPVRTINLLKERLRKSGFKEKVICELREMAK